MLARAIFLALPPRRPTLASATVLALVACNPAAGSRTADAGLILDAWPRWDTGGGPACPSEAEAYPSAPACAFATLGCIDRATTADAMGACIAADPAASACDACLRAEIVASCTTGEEQCAQQHGDVECCLDAACPGREPTCVAAATIGRIDMAPAGPCFELDAAQWACFYEAETTRSCGVTAAYCFLPDDGLAPGLARASASSRWIGPWWPVLERPTIAF